MNKIEELRQKFNRRLETTGTNIFYATVKVVDEKARTCTVEMDGINYENILLYAIEKPDLKGFVIIPALESQVLVCRLGADRYFVEMFSVIDKILLSFGEKNTATLDANTLNYKNDTVTLTITGDKVQLSAPEIILNGGNLGGLVKIEELKKNLNSLKTFVEAIHTALPSAFSAVGVALKADGANGGTAYSGAMAGEKITLENMENKKVKH